MDKAADCCSVCNKALTINNVAIVYARDNTITIGDCCIGRFMSSMIQDYALLLEYSDIGLEPLLYLPAAIQLHHACAYLSKMFANWSDICKSLPEYYK
jgi:hypothetical protein